MPTLVNDHCINEEYSTECKNLDASKFNELARENIFDLNSCGILHLNIRSISSNFDLLTAYLESLEYKFPIIVLTETWLANGDLDSFNLTGYQTFNKKFEFTFVTLSLPN